MFSTAKCSSQSKPVQLEGLQFYYYYFTGLFIRSLDNVNLRKSESKGSRQK